MADKIKKVQVHASVDPEVARVLEAGHWAAHEEKGDFMRRILTDAAVGVAEEFGIQTPLVADDDMDDEDVDAALEDED